MRRTEHPIARHNENLDPHELHKPIPKAILALVVVLLGWAIYYIATQGG